MAEQIHQIVDHNEVPSENCIILEVDSAIDVSSILNNQNIYNTIQVPFSGNNIDSSEINSSPLQYVNYNLTNNNVF